MNELWYILSIYSESSELFFNYLFTIYLFIYLFSCHGSSPFVPTKGCNATIRSKVLLTDHLYPMMKHFHPAGSGFTGIHWGLLNNLTEQLNTYESDKLGWRSNEAVWLLTLCVGFSLNMSLGSRFMMKPYREKHPMEEVCLTYMANNINSTERLAICLVSEGTCGAHNLFSNNSLPQCLGGLLVFDF